MPQSAANFFASNNIGDVDMDIKRVDVDIATLLFEAKKFAADWGIPQVGVDDKQKRSILAEAGGNCYEAALNLIMSLGEPWQVVHGMVSGQGHLTGTRFGHAWVENSVTGMIQDHSNGNQLNVSKDYYYSLGKISENNLIRYSRQDALKAAVNTGVFGPWDSKIC